MTAVACARARVDARHPANRRVKTLIHELAHALVRADRVDNDPQLDPAAEELVAETVAYSVCASSGIDPGEFSISCLAGWSEQTPTATIERTAALIDRLARRIGRRRGRRDALLSPPADAPAPHTARACHAHRSDVAVGSERSTARAGIRR